MTWRCRPASSHSTNKSIRGIVQEHLRCQLITIKFNENQWVVL